MRYQLRRIKWAYQRVRYGYDDTIKWGFDSNMIMILKPLRDFCSDYLELEQSKLNKERSRVFRHTIKLIDEYNNVCENWQDYGFMEEEEYLKKVAVYYAKNLGWYWD